MTTQVISTPAAPSTRRTALALLALWFAFAFTVGATGAMRALPFQVIPLFVGGTNLALFAWYRRSERFRAFVRSLSWRALAAPHAVRAPIGAGFLVLMADGVMPASIALHAGIGDIIAGAGALALALTPGAARPRWFRAWNVFGLVDIVTVVLGFQRVLVFEHHPRLAERFAELPFTLLPFFLVPLVVATHVAMLARDEA